MAQGFRHYQHPASSSVVHCTPHIPLVLFAPSARERQCLRPAGYPCGGKALYVQQAEAKLRAGSAWEGWQNAKERQTALVFTNEVGCHLIQNTVVAHFNKIVGSIGAPETRVHDLRHTFAVLSLQNGDDLKTVQENLGHATASFTLDVYGHVLAKMKQESANRMQNYISKIGNE